MLEELKKSIDKGLEFAVSTRDKITQAAKEMAKENKLTKEEAKKLLDHLLEKSDEARKNLETEVQKVIQASLKKMKVPTQDEIKVLETRIKALEGSRKSTVNAKPAAKPAAKRKPPVAGKQIPKP